MDNKVPYENWPARVKIGTALSNKSFLITNHSIPLVLGYIVLAMGVLNLVFRIFQGEVIGFKDTLYPLAFIVIGLFNLGGSSIVKWIADHSTWEERFANTSSTQHKALSILSLVILFLCVYVIFAFE